MRYLLSLLLLSLIPLSIQSRPTHSDSLLIEKIANARIVNVDDSVQLYVQKGVTEEYEKAEKIALGTKFVIPGDTTLDMLEICVFDTLRYVSREYVEFDSLAFKSGIYTARNNVGAVIPLKWLHIAMLIFGCIGIICCFSGAHYIKLLVLYALMNGTAVAAYYCHNYNFLFNHIWTGGWLNGYFLSNVNGALMLIPIITTYLIYRKIARSAMNLSTHDDDNYTLHTALLFWAPVVFVLLMMVLGTFNVYLSLIAWAFYIGLFILHMFAFKRHLIVGLLIFLFAPFSFFVCSCYVWYLIISKVLIWFILIPFALYLIKHSPELAMEYAKSDGNKKDTSDTSYPHEMIETEDGWVDAEFRGDGYYANGGHTRYNRDSSTNIYMRD